MDNYILQISLYPNGEGFNKEAINFNKLCIKARVAYTSTEFLNESLAGIRTLHEMSGYVYDNTFIKDGIIVYLPVDKRAPIVILNIVKIKINPTFTVLAQMMAGNNVTGEVEINDDGMIVEKDEKTVRPMTIDELRAKIAIRKAEEEKE